MSGTQHSIPTTPAGCFCFCFVGTLGEGRKQPPWETGPFKKGAKITEHEIGNEVPCEPGQFWSPGKGLPFRVWWSRSVVFGQESGKGGKRHQEE